MPSDAFKCPICCFRYDKLTHIPKVLPCGHTLCSTCIDEIQKKDHLCPFDRTVISQNPSSDHKDFPTNLLLNQLLAEPPSSSEELNLCQAHMKKQALVCLTDNVLICKYCSQYGEHRDHEVLHIGDVTEQIKEKKKTLKSYLRTIADSSQETVMESILDFKKAEVRQQCLESFRTAKEELEKKEEAVLEEIEQYYTDEKIRIEEQDKENLGLLEEIRAQIQILEDGNIKDPLVLETFQKDAEIFEYLARDRKQELTDSLDEANKRLRERCNDFNDALFRKAHSFEILPSMENFEDLIEVQSESQTDPQPQIQIQDQEDQQVQIQVEDDSDWSTQSSVRKNDIEEEEKKEAGVVHSSNSHAPKGSHLEYIPVHSQISENKVAFIQSNIVGTYHKDIKQLVISPTHRGIETYFQLPLDVWKGFQQLVIDLNRPLSKDFANALKILPELLGKGRFDMKVKFSNKGLPEGDLLNLCPTKTWMNHQIYAFELEMQGFHKSQALNQVLKGLHVVRGLQIISLELTDTHLHQEFINELDQALSAHKNLLRSVEFFFGNTHLPETSFKTICQALSRCQKLSSISLDFSDLRLQEAAFKPLFTKTLPALKGLVSFSLYICASRLTDANIAQMCNGMQGCRKHIKTFGLDLTETWVTEKGLEVLAHSLIKGMKALQVFQLQFSSTDVTDAGLLAILDELANTSNELQNLRLDFAATNISDASLASFRRYNLPAFKKLQYLELRMTNSRVTNSGFEQLVEGIRQTQNVMKTLRRFEYKMNNVKEQTLRKIDALRSKLH